MNSIETSQPALKQRNADQLAEALSDLNIWFASEGLGRPPTPSEAVLWYIEHGGAVNYAKRIVSDHNN